MEKPMNTYNTTDDDRVLDARDMAEEIAASKQAISRQFPDVINEWTETCLEANRNAEGHDMIILIGRLGVLGQRLIYEANQLGMRDAAAAFKEMR